MKQAVWLIAVAALTLSVPMSVFAQESDLETRFDRAAECRVHTELLPAIMNDSPQRLQHAHRVFEYWRDQTEKIAQELDYDERRLMFSLLVIEITADMDLINSCIEEYQDATR